MDWSASPVYWIDRYDLRGLSRTFRGLSIRTTNSDDVLYVANI
jgi:hypothetical protein